MSRAEEGEREAARERGEAEQRYSELSQLLHQQLSRSSLLRGALNKEVHPSHALTHTESSNRCLEEPCLEVQVLNRTHSH